MSPTGIVFDIQRFSVHDGPGIRSTVFLKGCPLRCPWCHNPESWGRQPQVLFLQQNCIGCGRCREVCPVEGAIVAASSGRVNRDLCTDCRLCAQVCVAQALYICGRVMELGEVVAEIEKDRAFYETSGGGMTVSGGEPLMQPEFTVALLHASKRIGLHAALDTSGFAAADEVRAAAEFADLVLFDLKIADPLRHRELIGVDGHRVLESLELLAHLGTTVVVRMPLVPGMTDAPDNLTAIARTVARFDNVQEVNLMRYHGLGGAKWRQMGLPVPALGLVAPTDRHVSEVRRIFEAHGCTVRVF